MDLSFKLLQLKIDIEKNLRIYLHIFSALNLYTTLIVKKNVTKKFFEPSFNNTK